MEYLEVDTGSGRLRGRKDKSIDGFEFYAFRGIPYAKPPLGPLRFKDPVPPEPWTGTRDAFEFGSMCIQHDLITSEYGGSEDCLYLNVYVKKIEPNVRYPVMMWVHGGGFVFGSGDDMLYGPDYLVEKDIVLVTINYRLGVLGFLNLQDDIAPGNQGLKDQVMALKWIRDNIGNFGGDNKNVTAFGQSAGGAAVHYLAMSPLSKGLIHKVISQSATALCPWASVQGDPKLMAYKLCELLNIETKVHKDLFQLLQEVDVKDLVGAQGKLSVMERNMTVFGPASDRMSPEPFLPEPLNKVVMKGVDIPYLLGYTNRENAFFYKLMEKMSGLISKDLNLHKQFHPNVPSILSKYNLSIADFQKIYGFEDSMTDTDVENNLEKFIDMHGDINFVHGVDKVIRIQIERSMPPTYMYKFEYDKGYGFTKAMFDCQMSGASHLDDLFYIFSMKFLEKLGLKPFVKESENHRVMRQMVEMWTNFAIFGVPTPTVSSNVSVIWKPVADKSSFSYMSIGEKLQIGTSKNIEERFVRK